MSENAWFDISVIQCPNCGRYYADASWYVVEMGADTECGTCHTTFNTKKNATDRILLNLKISDKGRVHETEIMKHFSKRKRQNDPQKQRLFTID